jgi:surfeit locus 1 family protein
MSRYGFLLRPRWLLFHAVVAVLVIVMINLALWQLRRLHERQRFNATVAARTAAATVAFDAAVAPGTTIDGARAAEWTRVSVTGRFDAAAQVLIRNRSQDSQPGSYVITPLQRATGDAVLVNRGFIPLTDAEGHTAVPPAPTTATVTVEGWVRPTQNPGALQHRDPSSGKLTTMARVDIPRIGAQTLYPLAPAYVQLAAIQPPPAAALPAPVPLPALDDGPHLGYAVQWCIFSVGAVVGWVVVVRKSARDRQRAALRAASPGQEPGQRAGIGEGQLHPQP